MVWYVLNNCSQVEKYVRMFREELQTAGVHNFERKIRLGFQTWFSNHIMRLRDTHQDKIDEDLFSLACALILESGNTPHA
ncbi:hypothetical protein PVAP13_6NG156103 [Panicum virgatum]|uniref:Uncharacterized protein n=1 Tax=Panicum virgatum TaxID=38727 RepID=A0A8T0QXP8_PANVG|nr:hypothetical protein PVAP13_6NG156103 [Panicum virgatum]